MKDVYMNELTQEPFYISPEYDPHEKEGKNDFTNRKTYKLHKVNMFVVVGVSALWFTIGFIVGILIQWHL